MALGQTLSINDGLPTGKLETLELTYRVTIQNVICERSLRVSRSRPFRVFEFPTPQKILRADLRGIASHRAAKLFFHSQIFFSFATVQLGYFGDAVIRNGAPHVESASGKAFRAIRERPAFLH
jgi:hypothetical protein